MIATTSFGPHIFLQGSAEHTQRIAYGVDLSLTLTHAGASCSWGHWTARILLVQWWRPFVIDRTTWEWGGRWGRIYLALKHWALTMAWVQDKYGSRFSMRMGPVGFDIGRVKSVDKVYRW